MKRKSIGTRHEMIVQPTFLIGTYNEDGSPDFAPITWVSKTCEKDYDYLIVISMYGTKKTKQNVQRTGQFCMNLATSQMITLVDYFGQISGKKGRKDALPYDFSRAECVEAPTLDQSPWVCECEVAQTVTTGQSDTFSAGSETYRWMSGLTWIPGGLTLRLSTPSSTQGIIIPSENTWVRSGIFIGKKLK